MNITNITTLCFVCRRYRTARVRFTNSPGERATKPPLPPTEPPPVGKLPTAVFNFNAAFMPRCASLTLYGGAPRSAFTPKATERRANSMQSQRIDAFQALVAWNASTYRRVPGACLYVDFAWRRAAPPRRFRCERGLTETVWFFSTLHTFVKKKGRVRHLVQHLERGGNCIVPAAAGAGQ